MRDFLDYYFSPRRFIGDVQRAVHTVRMHVPPRLAAYTVEEMRGLSVLRWITSSFPSLIARDARSQRHYRTKHTIQDVPLSFPISH